MLKHEVNNVPLQVQTPLTWLEVPHKVLYGKTHETVVCLAPHGVVALGAVPFIFRLRFLKLTRN
jgi:hypothetical protein